MQALLSQSRHIPRPRLARTPQGLAFIFAITIYLQYEHLQQHHLKHQTVIIKMGAINQAPNGAAPPSPPFITVAGIQNFRDLGGYTVSSRSNHSIRREFIYRCAEPSGITKDGIAAIKKLGITHMYDLRSNPEIERAQAAGRGGIITLWDGCERVFVPVFADQNYSPESLAIRFRNYASSGTEVRLPQDLKKYGN